MTNEQLQELKKLAKDYCEIYSKTGLAGISSGIFTEQPEVQLNAADFFETFGDNFEIGRGEEHEKQNYRSHVEDGILFFTILDDYRQQWLKDNTCKRCGRFYEDLNDGLCDVCYGDLYGEDEK